MVECKAPRRAAQVNLPCARAQGCPAARESKGGLGGAIFFRYSCCQHRGFPAQTSPPHEYGSTAPRLHGSTNRRSATSRAVFASSHFFAVLPDGFFVSPHGFPGSHGGLLGGATEFLPESTEFPATSTEPARTRREFLRPSNGLLRPSKESIGTSTGHFRTSTGLRGTSTGRAARAQEPAFTLETGFYTRGGRPAGPVFR